MKHYSFLACLLLCCVSMTAAAKDVIVPDTMTGGIYPYEKGVKYSNLAPATAESHWALYVPFGMTFADMDESHGAKLGSGLSDLTVNLGFGVEYDFTPVWGVALEFLVANYGKNSFTATKQSDGTRAEGTSFGNMYNMTAMLSFDFMDAFFPKRRQTIFNLYALVGGGAGVFTYTPEKKVAGSIETYDDTKPFSYGTNGKDYGWSPFLGFGLLADFNITRSFSMGIRGMYDYYMTDLVDGPDRKATGKENGRVNSNNDGLFTADLVLRWKINAKNKSHVSNCSEKMIADAVAIAEAREDAVHQQAEEIRRTYMKDTLVISHKDTLVVMNEKKETKAADDYYFVYFGNDKYSLDDQALVDIQKVAFRLEQDSSLCLELAGFADNTGSAKRNEELAKKRSEAVRDMLVNVYGIDESRLLPMGKGQLTNVKSSFAPNRRVNMHVVTKEELEKTRKQVEEQERLKAEKAAGKGVENGAEAEPKKSEEERLSELDIQYDHEKFVGVEVVDQKTTLSKLARKYYGNTNCWVYIYRTNKDVIKTPSYLWPNTKLYMPILSDEEKNITKEQALELMKTVK